METWNMEPGTDIIIHQNAHTDHSYFILFYISVVLSIGHYGHIM